MQIESRFTVPLPPDRAWAVLLDIPRIAPCMPGAKLLSVEEGAKAFLGEVQVRLGPVLLAFKGRAEFTALDEQAKTATVRAEGRDTKGRGGASADVAFSLVPQGTDTEVVILTELNLSGSVAQYGRGAGMINDLANHLIGQFAANLRKEIEASATTAAATDPGAQAGDEPVGTTGQNPVAPATPAREAAPISGFSLMFGLLWRRIKRLFGAA